MRLTNRLTVFVATLAMIGGLGFAAPSASELASACIPEEVGGVAGAPLTSTNVSYVCTIPLDAPGNAGHIQTVDGETRLYVSSRKGISIYDVTEPAHAELLGHLPFQHWQNEDASVADDGSRMIVAADGGFPFPDVVATGLWVFDTSDPASIELIGVHPDAPHTATCADPACHYLYASNGNIYDASNLDQAIPLADGLRAAQNGQAIGMEKKGIFARDAAGKRISLHASQRDASGLVITDSTPRLILDPREDPLNPVLVNQFGPGNDDPRLQHSNLRPDAGDYTPREDGYVPGSLGDDPMRPGEILVASSESNLNARCTNSGSISTFDLRGFDQGLTPTQLDVLHPVNAAATDPTSPDPQANVAGCSAHWFDMDGEIMAASWYDHGTRFLRIDLATGAIEQLGWFQPRNGLATATFWGSDGYAFTVDNTRGIDVTRFHAEGDVPTEAEFDASWLGVRATAPLAEQLRLYCQLGA